MRYPWRRGWTAGRSSQAYYEAGLAWWHRTVAFPLAASGVVAALLAVVIWRIVPHGSFCAGIIIGGVSALMQWIWSEPPDFVARRKRGVAGERATEREVRRLEGEGWYAFHDLLSDRGNFDHVLVSASGVFLLDSKNLAGEITLDDEYVLTARFENSPRDTIAYTGLAGWMRGSAFELNQRIATVTGLNPWVQAVVVVWGQFPCVRASGDKVEYVAGASLNEWLREQRPRLSAIEVNKIKYALGAGLIADPAEAATPGVVVPT